MRVATLDSHGDILDACALVDEGFCFWLFTILMRVRPTPHALCYGLDPV
jgi:hypothetical protein